HDAFQSRAFSAMNIQGLSLSGNTEPCPRCGRQSRIMDGKFNVDDSGNVEVISAPAWTRAALREMRDTLVSAREATPEDPDAMFRTLEETNPAAAKLVDARTSPAWTREQKLALFTALIALLTLWATIAPKEDANAVTPEELKSIIDTAVKHVNEGTEPPPPTSTGN
ncbi:hypothetical protein, partial [Shimia sediminis]|uniref:hypothetical protein n=1 Tax=Shimia sediminis TaxID=2497945 RepID=UPI00197DD5E6